MRKTRSIAIVGTVGLPARYGGFETLVENLVRHQERYSLEYDLTIYCSSRAHRQRASFYRSARLKYVPLRANGIQSILYDVISLFSAAWNRFDVILLLGVSGGIALPLIKLICPARIITNIDGMEWRRGKWPGPARFFLRLSEGIAVRFSDELISDNAVITRHIEDDYGVPSYMIAYGGDHAVEVDAALLSHRSVPSHYAVSVCRIEPENNIHLILEAFNAQDEIGLVLVGNWDYSGYGRKLRKEFGCNPNLHLYDPVYDLGMLKTLRSKAALYVHGHSAGGTNPSLVEAMHFGLPIIAFDCDFNRSTTENMAIYFSDVNSLRQKLFELDTATSEQLGDAMLEIAQRRYTWGKIAEEYFSLMH